MKINIKYSIDFEVKMVLYIQKKIDWFNEHGYKLSLPERIDQGLIKSLSIEQISDIVAKEYQEKDYKLIEANLQKEWVCKTGGLEKKLKNLNLNFLDSYEVLLSKYGTGGSYNLPNKIIINFKIRRTEDLPRIIIHEIIHLIIEPMIKKYNVDHWVKERIVDLSFSRIYPELGQMQKVSISTEKIDNVFNELYPDIEKIIQNINR